MSDYISDEVRTEDMDCLERMAAGIAGDFNDLLTTILGHCALINEKISPDSPVYRHIREIDTAGNRAASLTSQALAFSRQQWLESEIIDINSSVLNSKPRLDQILGHRITLFLELNPDRLMVNIDPAQFDEVLAAFAGNARQAMPDGGRLDIKITVLDEDVGEGLASPPAESEMSAVISISDSGTGMDPLSLADFFSPYSRSKDRPEGCGLALSSACGIIRQSGGWIEAESELDRGTEIRIYLPIIVNQAGEAIQLNRPKSDVDETVIAGGADDVHIRSLARGILQRSGYAVPEENLGTPATGSSEAVVTFEGQPSRPVHVPLTDAVID